MAFRPCPRGQQSLAESRPAAGLVHLVGSLQVAVVQKQHASPHGFDRVIGEVALHVSVQDVQPGFGRQVDGADPDLRRESHPLTRTVLLMLPSIGTSMSTTSRLPSGLFLMAISAPAPCRKSSDSAWRR